MACCGVVESFLPHCLVWMLLSTFSGSLPTTSTSLPSWWPLWVLSIPSRLSLVCTCVCACVRVRHLWTTLPLGVFVLVLSALPVFSLSHSDRLTLTKVIVVSVSVGGAVLVGVSQISGSGTLGNLGLALCYSSVGAFL